MARKKRNFTLTFEQYRGGEVNKRKEELIKALKINSRSAIARLIWNRDGIDVTIYWNPFGVPVILVTGYHYHGKSQLQMKAPWLNEDLILAAEDCQYQFFCNEGPACGFLTVEREFYTSVVRGVKWVENVRDEHIPDKSILVGKVPSAWL